LLSGLVSIIYNELRSFASSANASKHIWIAKR